MNVLKILSIFEKEKNTNLVRSLPTLAGWAFYL